MIELIAVINLLCRSYDPSCVVEVRTCVETIQAVVQTRPENILRYCYLDYLERENYGCN